MKVVQFGRIRQKTQSITYSLEYKKLFWNQIFLFLTDESNTKAR